MKLLGCLLLMIGFVIGLSEHKPAAMAMEIELSVLAIDGASDNANIDNNIGSASDMDAADAGHCLTPATLMDGDSDMSAVCDPLAAWTPPDEGVEGSEPPPIGRPPNLQ